MENKILKFTPSSISDFISCREKFNLKHIQGFSEEKMSINMLVRNICLRSYMQAAEIPALYEVVKNELWTECLSIIQKNDPEKFEMYSKNKNYSEVCSYAIDLVYDKIPEIDEFIILCTNISNQLAIFRSNRQIKPVVFMGRLGINAYINSYFKDGIKLSSNIHIISDKFVFDISFSDKNYTDFNPRQNIKYDVQAVILWLLTGLIRHDFLVARVVFQKKGIWINPFEFSIEVKEEGPFIKELNAIINDINSGIIYKNRSFGCTFCSMRHLCYDGDMKGLKHKFIEKYEDSGEDIF